MGSTSNRFLPYAPEQIWAILPSGVAQNGWGMVRPMQGWYTLSFSTGVSMTTWGLNITVQLVPHGHGTNVVVRGDLKFGLVDWGEGNRVAERLYMSIAQWVAHSAPPAHDHPPPPPPPPAHDYPPPGYGAPPPPPAY